jgi:polar amino acid transport system substrate-binding protein
MRGSKRTATLAIASAVASALLVSACTAGGPVKTLQPKVKPPVIAKAGVLRAAIDLRYPPFGGTEKSQRVGLDMDVASALAEKLGLKLEVVDSRPEAGAVLLRDGKVDIMLAGLGIDRAVALDVAFAGSYVNGGPAIYSAGEATVTLSGLLGKRVAVQRESASYWILAEEYGEEALTPVPSLREAFSAVASGTADFAVGDGVVSAYLLRDFTTLRFNGQLAPAVPIGVAVAKDKPELEAAVRGALDDLSAQGVLEILRSKWMGDVPRLTGATDASATLDSTLTP